MILLDDITKKKTAIIALTNNGYKLALKISKCFQNVTIFYKQKDLDSIFRKCFQSFENIIAIMALGIVVRKIGDLIINKVVDPAVLVIDEKGKFVISFLSGHLGGANSLANYISKKINAIPVITTATDVNNKPAIDEMVRKFGWYIENSKYVKVINKDILNNKKIAINVPKEFFYEYFDCKYLKKVFVFYKKLGNLLNSKYKKVIVSNINNLFGDFLLIRPKNIYIGIGCNRNTPFEEIEFVILDTLDKLNKNIKSINCISSIDLKKDEKGLLDFAEKYGIKLKFYSREELNSVKEKFEESEYLKNFIGVKGVCEPSAILSAKKDLLKCLKRRTLLQKVKKGNVTIAIQELIFS